MQNIQLGLRLNGKNYLKCSQFVQTFLKGKGKLSHLFGIGSKLGDLKFSTWDKEDSVVMSWLQKAMMPETNDACMFLKITKDIWENCRQNYSIVSDAA